MDIQTLIIPAGSTASNALYTSTHAEITSVESDPQIPIRMQLSGDDCNTWAQPLDVATYQAFWNWIRFVAAEPVAQDVTITMIRDCEQRNDVPPQQPTTATRSGGWTGKPVKLHREAGDMKRYRV